MLSDRMLSMRCFILSLAEERDLDGLVTEENSLGKVLQPSNHSETLENFSERKTIGIMKDVESMAALVSMMKVYYETIL